MPGLGLGFVVVQHMSPTHRSMMAQLLGRTTPMTVCEVSDGCRPLPDTLLVTPPNSKVVLGEDGLLHLQEPPSETVPKPKVNLFFKSLAEGAGERAIGVVLSGTGNDGAAGPHAIKAAGGYAFAQESASAKYDGMSRAAIEAGGVDWVLPAEAIRPELARLGQRQQRSDREAEPARAAHDDHRLHDAGAPCRVGAQQPRSAAAPGAGHADFGNLVLPRPHGL